MHQRSKTFRLHLERRGAARGVFDADGDEVEADGRDHQTGDQRWEQESQLSDNRAQKEVTHASDNDSADDDGHALRRRDSRED